MILISDLLMILRGDSGVFGRVRQKGAMMQRLSLNVSDRVYDEILSLLERFASDIEIIDHGKSKTDPSSLRGVFSDYADALKEPLESSAWQKQVVDRYRNELL